MTREEFISNINDFTSFLLAVYDNDEHLPMSMQMVVNIKPKTGRRDIAPSDQCIKLADRIAKMREGKQYPLDVPVVSAWIITDFLKGEIFDDINDRAPAGVRDALEVVRESELKTMSKGINHVNVGRALKLAGAKCIGQMPSKAGGAPFVRGWVAYDHESLDDAPINELASIYHREKRYVAK